MLKLKRLLCLSLAVVMLFAIAACAADSGDTKVTGDAATTAGTEANADILAYLPDQNFNGETFNIMCRTDQLTNSISKTKPAIPLRMRFISGIWQSKTVIT